MAHASRTTRRWLWAKLAVILLIVVGVSGGWFVLRLRHAESQRKAVAAIRRLGGWSFYNCRFNESGELARSGSSTPLWIQRLLGVDFFGRVDVAVLVGSEPFEGLPEIPFIVQQDAEVNDAHLEMLRQLPDIKQLSIGHTRVTDAGLAAILPSLTRLERLWLDDTQVSDAGLEHLQTLTKLEALWLDNTPVTAAGLRHLRRLVRLKRLSLAGTQVSDDGLVHLAGMTKLESLRLDGSPCTFSGVLEFFTEQQQRTFDDALRIAGYAKWHEFGAVVSLDLSITRLSDGGLQHIKRLKELQWLDLNGTQVTDAGLQHVEGFEKLALLHLGDTSTTDAGLLRLRHLRQLRTLHLEGTQVTAAGIEQFKRATADRVRVYASRSP